MWDRYLNDPNYKWQHLRIRAEASGVALNAHSSGVADIDVRGLKALTHKLAESALDSLGLSDDQISTVENALLRTVIKEWGTKSYEFSLSKVAISEQRLADSPDKLVFQETKIFRSHCYFGLKPKSHDQDCLQHLKCYIGDGGSTKVLDFLLAELRPKG